MHCVHIIYVVDDGITTLRCGVGAIAINFIAAFPEILTYFIRQGIHLRLSVISFKSPSNAVNRRDDLFKHAKSVCHSTGGKVYLIISRRQAGQEYFDFGTWKEYNNGGYPFLWTPCFQLMDSYISC